MSHNEIIWEEPVLTDYYIDGQKLSPVEAHSYLGVTLSNDLKWNSHVDNIVAKANRSLCFVMRNLYPCSESTKCLAYSTIVRANLEYSDSLKKIMTELLRLQKC